MYSKYQINPTLEFLGGNDKYYTNLEIKVITRKYSISSLRQNSINPYGKEIFHNPPVISDTPYATLRYFHFPKDNFSKHNPETISKK